MCIQTSVIASESISHWSLEQQQNELQQDYDLLNVNLMGRWVGGTYHPEGLDVKVNSKAQGARSWAADLRKLNLQGSHFAAVTSLCIRQENKFQQEATVVPVQLMATLCRVIPNLQHLECDMAISGDDGEFREWAMHLANRGLTHVILRQPYGSTTEESCQKWERVVAAVLASGSIQALKIKRSCSPQETDTFSYATSIKILEKMEQLPKKIQLNLPLFFHSMEEAARYYKASRQSNFVVRCSSPLNKDSFMGRYFQSHNLPEISECTLHVTGKRKTPGSTATPISVRVSKRELSDPQQLTVELQKLLGRSVKVTPPVISKLELFMNSNYLKSRFIYSQFPEHLWDTSGSSMNQDYQEMVSLLSEGRVFGQDSVAALYEWFLVHPSNLLQLDY